MATADDEETETKTVTSGSPGGNSELMNKLKGRGKRSKIPKVPAQAPL